METKLEKLPKSRVKLEIKVSPIEMGGYFQRAFTELSSSLDLPGFRKGKAPEELARKSIDPAKMAERVLEIVIPITYYKAIKEKNIIPLHSPKVNVSEFGRDKPLVYQAEVDIMPDVRLADYMRLKRRIASQIRSKKIEKPQEKEIEVVLKRLQRQLAAFKPVDRPSKMGDFLEIDFEAQIDKKPLPESKSKNHPLVLGEGQFIEQFEKNLVGLKKGEEKRLEVEFPADHFKKELAGKNVEFFVKVNEVKEIILPEIEDSFAEKIGKKDLKGLKNSISESLSKEAQRREEERQEKEMINQIVSTSEVEIPGSLVLNEVIRNYQNFIAQIENKGLKFDQYLKQINKTPDDILKELRKPSEENVKISLVIEAIKEKEKISVSEREIEEEIHKIKEQKIEVKNDEDRAKIKNILGIKKTIERLKDIVLEK